MGKKKNHRLYFGCFFVTILLVLSCNKWEKHLHPNNEVSHKTLIQEIKKTSSLSQFSKYLERTGLDEKLNSFKGYTVWAPDNKAFDAISPELKKDTGKLRQLLLNHIAIGSYFVDEQEDTNRILMLNGKRVPFYENNFDSAKIVRANDRAKNGVLHIIDKVVPPLPNIWEVILSSKNQYVQNNYISELDYSKQDPATAVVDSISSITGEPVYKPGTGIVTINSFKNNIYDVSNEDSLFTYIILSNDEYDKEKQQLKGFFKSSDPAVTDSNASWSVVKDLIFKGQYLIRDWPDYFMSKSGVSIKIDKGDITKVERVSNGMVYFVRSLSFPLSEKIPSCIIQGEDPIGFSDSSENFINNVFYRERINNLTGERFTDIYLNLGSSGGGAYVDYATNKLYTTKYKVYWVALNDYTPSPGQDGPYGTKQPLPQILQIGSYEDTAFVPSFDVQKDIKPDDYSEVYLGEYENVNFDWLLQLPSSTESVEMKPQPGGNKLKSFNFTPATIRLSVGSPKVLSEGIPHNITIDYIKLVPDFD